MATIMRLTGMRLRGALGDGDPAAPPTPPRLPPRRHDPNWSARVKAFARLTMTEEEQARWL